MPGHVPADRKALPALATDVSLQPGERVLRRRAKAVIASALIVAGALVVAAVAAVIVAETDWGHRRIVALIESEIAGQLAPGVRLRIGRIDGGLNGAWSADSIALTDSAGTTVLSIGHASASLSARSLIRGDVRLGILVLRGVRAFLDQNRDGSWNVNHLARQKTDAGGKPGPRRTIVADSVALLDGRMELQQLDTNPALPKVRRVFSDVNGAFGVTTISSRDSVGGWAPVRTLRLVIDRPPVTLVSATGNVRWWSDSLRLDIPTVRLPASRAGVHGIIAWPAKRPVQLTLDVAADSVSVTDVQWMSKLFPSEGTASAAVAVRSVPGGLLRYDVSRLNLVAFSSRIAGSLSITPGRRTEVRNLALDLQPLDFALVRNVFGDTILKPAWRGAISGRVAGRGGALDSLLIDTIAITYADARVPGAVSRASGHGVVDVGGVGTRLVGMAIAIQSLDVRTLGAVAKAADSLRGVLVGRVTLDGPTRNLLFRDLWLQHVDGDRARSTVSGSGRIATDMHTQWLDATLALDTIAVATLLGDKTTLPLRGMARGTLGLRATGDTMTIDATVRADSATAHVTGTTLLDSTRTVMDLSGTLSKFDARTFVARKEIPATSLSGTIHLELDESATRIDRHFAINLDTSSRIGDSQVRAGSLRLGIDSAGFHMDTADVRTSTWQLEGRGRLARTGVTDDSVTFTAAFDSLAVLKTLLLDSSGAPRFKEFDGRARLDSGVVVGSFESATVRALFGAEALRVGTTTVERAIGRLAITGLPDSATGPIHATVQNLTSGALAIDLATMDATLDHGKRAHITASASTGDTIRVSAGADVTWPDSAFRIALDTLSAVVGEHRWHLEAPAAFRVSAGTTELDSLVMRSDHLAAVMLSGSFPDRGPINGSMRLTSLGLAEIAFLGLLPTDLSGTIGATATITGTRDAPVIAVAAQVDSIRSVEENRPRPSLAFEANYAARKATVKLGATTGTRRVLDITGDVPLDLSLRSVENRIIDAPMALRLRADSVPLADFEALTPTVTGLGGSLSGNVDVGGTLRHPSGRGTLDLRNGSFEVPAIGFVGRGAAFALELAGDSVIVKTLRVADGDQANDTASVTGVILLAGSKWSEWTVNLRSTANHFRVIDDPRLATAEADWQLAINGALGAPNVSGAVRLPYAVFTIGAQKRARVSRSAALTRSRLGTPVVTGVIVSLGNDVRLKSRDANVQLAGEVELFGPLDKPWISGSVFATRGTYRVDLGAIKRTFRVDSGTVIVEGTTDIPAALDIWTSYTVRRADEDDIHVTAHLYGTSDKPRLDLSSDLGSASAQSEIISYLVFGKPSFGVAADRKSTMQTATAALVPTIGGVLEGMLGTILPFFNTLQVTSLSGEGTQNVIQSPIDGLLNSYAVVGGRQIGSDSFFTLSGGVCRASGVSAANSKPFWLGTSTEYRPKRTIGATIAIDPGSSPCTRTGTWRETYQIGLDLSYEWKFGGRRRKP